MPNYTQSNRPLEVITPLGKDVLLLAGFTGTEGISQLFNFQIDMLALNEVEIPFEKLLGQPIMLRVDLPKLKPRYFNGICSRFTQGARDRTFTGYRMELVPKFWLLTKRADIRTFQHKSVPDILKEVLKDLDVAFEIQGKFEPRDYCVQYRETDFNFASRLMEEEGIYYFFKHSQNGHKLVLANTPQSHPDVPERSSIIFEGMTGGERDEDRVFEWHKGQEVRTPEHVLWDHIFDLPYNNLEAKQEFGKRTIQAGKVTHSLAAAVSDRLQVYDYPGEYAQRFDGVDKGGSPNPADVQKVFEDNKRTVGIRSQQEATPVLVISGTSTCRQFSSGHKFTLERHFNADGPYVLTTVQHLANTSVDYRTGHEGEYRYQNTFNCIPLSNPFRPPRLTPKPFVQGTQTAVVAGPPGEEVFTDKYGRVKVQFFWDRLGKHNLDSSCWVRVAQPWAGKRWGASFWPRVGQEVIVDFLEGDPDRPIVVGSVYNADQMPPYQGQGLDSKHPHDNKLCGVKSNTTPGGVGFNEWRFDDTKGKEEIFIHAERDMDVRVKHDNRERIIHDRHLIVGFEKDGKKGGDQREMVYEDKHLHIHRHQEEHIEGNVKLTIGKGAAKDGGNQEILIEKNKLELIEGQSHLHIKQSAFEKVDEYKHLTVDKDRLALIGGNDDLHVKKNRSEQVEGMQSLTVGGEQRESIGADTHFHGKGDRNEKVDGSQSLTVGASQQEKVGQNHALEAGQEIHLKAGMKVILEAGMQLTIKGPGGFVDIGPSGVTIQGIMVLINSGGAAGTGSGSSPTAPKDPAAPTDATAPSDATKANPITPDIADDSKSGLKSVPDSR